MTAFFVIIAAFAGLAFGSFGNVVVHRVPRKESIVRPRSRCPRCGTELRAIDNIPLVSWLALGGKCRSCRVPISIRYPACEALVGLLWALAVVRLGACAGCNPFDAVAYMPFFFTLVVLSLIDLEHKVIPNRILYPGLGVSIVLLAVAAVAGDGLGDFVRAGLGSLASFAVFNVIHIASPGGMGYGDVRLSALIGLHLGYLGWAQIYAGFLIGFIFGAVVGVVLMVVGKAGRKTALPFGPFMALGAVVVSFWGDPIVGLWTGR